MTGPPSSSYPSQVSPSAVEISPENRREKLGFARNFAGFVLRLPAAIFGDQGETLPKFWQKVSCPKSSLVKEDIVLRSEPGVGVMPGSPQGSSRVPGNSGRVLSCSGLGGVVLGCVWREMVVLCLLGCVRVGRGCAPGIRVGREICISGWSRFCEMRVNAETLNVEAQIPHLEYNFWVAQKC
ncbi:unnamed protein product [Prunus armeniaca]